MDEKKIEVTKEMIMNAMMDIFASGDLKTLVDNNPMMMLLAPIIGIELWKKLNEEQEDEEDGK